MKPLSEPRSGPQIVREIAVVTTIVLLFCAGALVAIGGENEFVASMTDSQRADVADMVCNVAEIEVSGRQFEDDLYGMSYRLAEPHGFAISPETITDALMELGEDECPSEFDRLGI